MTSAIVSNATNDNAMRAVRASINSRPNGVSEIATSTVARISNPRRTAKTTTNQTLIRRPRPGKAQGECHRLTPCADGAREQLLEQLAKRQFPTGNNIAAVEGIVD